MQRNYQRMLAGIFGVALLLAVGCNASTAPAPETTAEIDPAAAEYLLTEEPAGAKSVIESKELVQDGEEVTLVGRIGGTRSPFVDGRAIFTIVDTSLKPCNEREDDACPTPWDYCCDIPTLPQATALVKLVDTSGETVAWDAKAKLGLKELQTVVVRGTAKRDEAGNLTLLAPALFVKGQAKG